MANGYNQYGQMFQRLLGGQGFNPVSGFPGFNDPNVNAEFKMSSPAGTPAQPQPAGGQGQTQGEGQVSPDILGLVRILAQGGSAFQGGPDRQTIIGNLGNVAGGFAQNALFNQFLQMLSGGGQGQQAVPFKQPE
jgi:hypothetical protein